MSKKIFIVYGHHNTQKSFNASIRDTFIDEAKKLNHTNNEIKEYLVVVGNLLENQKKDLGIISEN